MSEARIQSKFLEACKYNLQLSDNSRILILFDSTSDAIVKMIKPAIAQSHYRVEFLALGSKRPYKAIPEEITKKAKDVDAVIGVYNYGDHDDWSLSELEFRMNIIDLMQNMPIRYAHAPGLSADMLANGSFQCDFKKMAEDAEAFLRALDGAHLIHVTSPRGTDFHLELASRMKFETDAVIVPPGVETPGKTGNWPPGEVWVESYEKVERVGSVPVRIDSHGRIVSDICVGGITATVDPKQPITIVVKSDGWLESYDSPDVRFKRVKDNWTADAAKWKVQPYTQELGIGFNDRARIGTGNLLEDEKAKGTCHVAIGSYRSHTDFLIDRPTIKVTYMNGSVKAIMVDGKLRMV
ncbi:MAG: hypothetical protein ABSD49_12945 [Candidatus Bathyarchaeia archaeon]